MIAFVYHGILFWELLLFSLQLDVDCSQLTHKIDQMAQCLPSASHGSARRFVSGTIDTIGWLRKEIKDASFHSASTSSVNTTLQLNCHKKKKIKKIAL